MDNILDHEQCKNCCCNVVVKKQILNPVTNKRMRKVFVKGKGYFIWNSAYHVYNMADNYEQMTTRDACHIDYSK